MQRVRSISQCLAGLIKNKQRLFFFFRRIYGVSHIFTDAYIRFQIHGTLYASPYVQKSSRLQNTCCFLQRSINKRRISERCEKDIEKNYQNLRTVFSSPLRASFFLAENTPAAAKVGQFSVQEF